MSKSDNSTMRRYADVDDLLAQHDPLLPVYAIYPERYRPNTKRFLEGFPGRTLYAVKANDHPAVLQALYAAGVRHFDCASLAEIELVHASVGAATCYFMNPARIPGEAREAQVRFGVRHFVVDHPGALGALLGEIDAERSVVFARMAVSHSDAAIDLSSKFGARPEAMPALLDAIRQSGAEPALAFNVGSAVLSPDAYDYALGVARDVLVHLPFGIRLLDIGGGFPLSYPDFDVPPFERFFERIAAASRSLPLAEGGELLAEPGRALAAPGLSVVTRVLLKKKNRIYLNDGMYGGFWELRFKAHQRYACRAFRAGKPLGVETAAFRVFGPTCDSSDELPALVDLPADIAVGDHIEFGSIGAYSLSGRTDFNGFGAYDVVTFDDPGAMPP